MVKSVPAFQVSMAGNTAIRMNTFKVLHGSKLTCEMRFFIPTKMNIKVNFVAHIAYHSSRK